MTKRRILVVDDEANMVELLTDVLESEGYQVQSAGDGNGCLAKLEAGSYDVILLDLKLPDLDGTAVLSRIRDRGLTTPVIMITAHGTISIAVDAMRLGAFDFVVKPFDIERIKSAVSKAIAAAELVNVASFSKPTFEAPKAPPGSEIVGSSDEVRGVMDLVAKVADAEATVIIRGETGTGKELVAQAIHYNGRRREGPFVALNCAALPDSLLESEMFGFERGAFTGAYSKKIGRVEMASGGTLFLDEVGDMSPAMQAKLLRVLQAKKITRVGGTQPVDVDVRIISATNRDLEEAVQAGTFREDLYYRINVIPIFLPPLRERSPDVPALVTYFIEKYARLNHQDPFEPQRETLDCLMQYSWPGNIRELENVVEKGVVLGEEMMTPLECGLSGDEGQGCAVLTLRAASDRAQREAIISALRHTGGNKTEAAKVLGISYKTLFNKISELAIGDEDIG